MIFIPMKPMPAPRPRLSRFGVYNDHKYTKYKKDAQKFCRGLQISDRPIHLVLEFHFLQPKSWSKKKREATIYHTVKPDADNLAKTVKDFLNGIAYKDDSQVCILQVKKVYAEKEGIHIKLIYL